jgi:ketosteroid isomerase-like protein
MGSRHGAAYLAALDLADEIAEAYNGEMKTFLPALVHLMVVSCLFFEPAVAQQSDQPAPGDAHQLRDAIARMDSILFDAFNAHNTDALMAMFTADLEFYQDNDGLKNYEQCAGDFKKLFSSNTEIRRELVKDTLEVYPVKDYGAIEIGLHRFCHKEQGKIECASFKFVMIWRKSGTTWKVSRVVSYGHKMRPD